LRHVVHDRILVAEDLVLYLHRGIQGIIRVSDVGVVKIGRI
jgi:hypothetical protein